MTNTRAQKGTDVTETEAKELVASIATNKTKGWDFTPEQEESTRYAAAHAAYVQNEFWNNGDKYKLRIHADGRVLILVYLFDSRDRYGSYPNEAVSYKFESTQDLIDKVKNMIDNEDFAEFTRVLRTLNNVDGVSAYDREEQQEIEKAEMQAEIDAYEPPASFWTRLFGGK